MLNRLTHKSMLSTLWRRNFFCFSAVYLNAEGIILCYVIPHVKITLKALDEIFQGLLKA